MRSPNTIARAEKYLFIYLFLFGGNFYFKHQLKRVTGKCSGAREIEECHLNSIQ